MRVYGYARVSTVKQSIERQIRNIKEQFPDAIIVSESYTGTKMDRPQWSKLYSKAAAGDTIVFDEVSRMARNAAEGFAAYKDLYNRGVNLVFLKDHNCDSEVFRDAMETEMATQDTGDADNDFLVNGILNVLHEYNMRMIERQIRLSFEKAQSEVDFLRQRTREGIETARLNGKQIGQVPNSKLTTKKSVAAKEVIRKHSKDFGGTLSDADVMKLTGLSRNTFYKYKRELKSE